MIGDGVNDVLVFVVVDIGIVMGVYGFIVVSESVDVVILKDDFLCVVKVVVILKDMMRIVK